MGFVFLLNEVLDNEKAFNDYLHAVGAGNASAAVEAARRILNGVNSTLEKIQKEYPQLLIDAQIPDYADVRKKFEGPTPTLGQLGGLASRLENLVSLTEQEVKRFRRKEPPAWIAMVSAHGKRIALIAGGIFVAWILAWGVLKIAHRGQGLTGEYYNDMELGAFYRARVDRTIDFTWGKGSPFPRWHKNHFSIRWTGFLRIPESGHYDFYLHVDDGARLTIDNTLLVDDWKVHKLHVVQAASDLEAGYHPIRLDYFERSKLATMRLYWKRTTDPRPEPIPARYLVQSDAYLRKGVPVFGTSVESDSDADEPDEAAGPAPAQPAPASAGTAPKKR